MKKRANCVDLNNWRWLRQVVWILSGTECLCYSPWLKRLQGLQTQQTVATDHKVNATNDTRNIKINGAKHLATKTERVAGRSFRDNFLIVCWDLMNFQHMTSLLFPLSINSRPKTSSKIPVVYLLKWVSTKCLCLKSLKFTSSHVRKESLISTVLLQGGYYLGLNEPMRWYILREMVFRNLSKSSIWFRPVYQPVWLKVYVPHKIDIDCEKYIHNKYF